MWACGSNPYFGNKNGSSFGNTTLLLTEVSTSWRKASLGSHSSARYKLRILKKKQKLLIEGEKHHRFVKLKQSRNPNKKS